MATRPDALLALVLLVVTWSGCRTQGEGGAVVLWRGTDAFEERAESLPISGEEALAMLVTMAERPDLPRRYFVKTPAFIVGDDYFFAADLSKTTQPLEGFYVNGRTGAIEYRNSSVELDSKPSTLPENAFTEIVPIE